MRLRHWIRWLRAVLFATIGAYRLARHYLRLRRATLVIALHRVLDDDGIQKTASLTGMLLRRRTFQQLMRYAAQRFEMVDLGRAATGATPRLQCAVTFDDGWADNHFACLQAAGELGIPLAIFLCPDRIGCVRPFWPERVVAAMKAARPEARESEIEPFVDRLKTCTATVRRKALASLECRSRTGEDSETVDRTLSWNQIREMDRAGMTFGAHSQTHQVLTAVSDDAARREIVGSKQAIELALSKPCTMFAYPNGNHSSKTRELLEEAGFRFAFTTRCGAYTPETDPLAIPRILISESDVTNPWGWFSPAMLQYTVTWRGWRALQKGE